LIPGMALAQPPGNQPACVRCCKREYAPGERITRPDGVEVSARGYCISQSAITGVCFVTDCEDNGNGNNGECKYPKERVCLNPCIDGEIRVFSDDGSETTCEPDTGIVA
jgi:hypothetical protein